MPVAISFDVDFFLCFIKTPPSATTPRRRDSALSGSYHRRVLLQQNQRACEVGLTAGHHVGRQPMKVSRRIDGSICGAILFLHRPSSSTSSTWPAALNTSVPYCAYYNHGGGSGRGYHHRSTRPDRTSRPSATPPLRYSLTVPTLRKFSTIRFWSSFRPSFACLTKNNTTSATARAHTPEPIVDTSSLYSPEPEPKAESEPAHPPPGHSKEDLLALVDPYDGEKVAPLSDYIQIHADPYMRGYAPAESPRFSLARTKEQAEYPTPDEVIPPHSEEERQLLFELRFAVKYYIIKPEMGDLDNIYNLYQRLPEPKLLHLDANFRHQLLKALGQPPKLNARSMMRYFAVIGDVKNSGIALTRAEWNRVIYFGSKYVGRITEVENEAALKLWREMEVDAGIKGNDVTFNILFNVACKAGNFVLAEMIYREMEQRGHAYNRYHYVSLIYYFSLKYETGGMRAAYREMVLAGEIIDTVVLNAMISGLLRAGEESAADNIYERMKATNSDLGELPVKSAMSERAIAQALMMMGKLGRKFPEQQERFQSMALTTPDLQTYRILVNHYGKIGDLGRVAMYIDEMKYFQIPLHGAIFLALFKGFARHGRLHRSAWSERHLEEIFKALVKTLDDAEAGVHVQTWLAVWALRAFDSCSVKRRVMEVYDLLKERWDPEEVDEQFVMEQLAGMVRKELDHRVSRAPTYRYPF
ncbi:hypothetical protein B0T21DRAFT_369473 [Apiosordaria backusii]|uniref:Pentatricopeptide repeat-containing protein n=1 Tax=Apiosordaria backusii TaxID=314023 RepID=A0AA40BEF4_9PEZI|nr:hypothetical protein B0T21DRAFT_369473 [Apiosordaria backusii]